MIKSFLKQNDSILYSTRKFDIIKYIVKQTSQRERCTGRFDIRDDDSI